MREAARARAWQASAPSDICRWWVPRRASVAQQLGALEVAVVARDEQRRGAVLGLVDRRARLEKQPDALVMALRKKRILNKNLNKRVSITADRLDTGADWRVFRSIGHDTPRHHTGGAWRRRGAAAGDAGAGRRGHLH